MGIASGHWNAPMAFPSFHAIRATHGKWYRTAMVPSAICPCAVGLSCRVSTAFLRACFRMRHGRDGGQPRDLVRQRPKRDAQTSCKADNTAGRAAGPIPNPIAQCTALCSCSPLRGLQRVGGLPRDRKLQRSLLPLAFASRRGPRSSPYS